MDAVFLLSSIISTTITSTVLSILLLLRLLLSRFFRQAPALTVDRPARLYEGRVWHTRRRPVPHAFEYPVRYALVDLDLVDSPDSEDHLSAVDARDATGTDGPVYLLTIPKSVGYVQNPLSIYYCYDSEQEQDAQPKMCIAEVTNTPWGERVMFTFQPGSDLVAKPLHVSPFMDMLGNWSINAKAPGKELSVTISVQHPTLGNYFTATLHAKLVGNSSNTLTLASFFWLMPHKVAIWIYWEAVRLLFKKVKLLGHPKFLHPDYRDEALKRDNRMRCSCSFLQNMNNSTSQSDGESIRLSQFNSTRNINMKERWCVWRDAKWPWA